MNQSDLAEQGAVPLATLNPLEATPDVPTMAARNTTEHSERRPDHHFAPNTETGQPEMPSGYGKTSKVIPNEPRSPIDQYIGGDTLPGWPTIASKQSRPLNTGLWRHFALFKSRVTADQHTKLSSMGKAIHELDQDDARNNSERLKKLLYDVNHLLFHKSGACSCTQDPKDQALEAYYDRLIKYYLFIFLSRKMEETPKVSSSAYKNFRGFVRSDLPDGEAWDALTGEKDDFITTRTSPLDKELEWLHWLLDGKPRLGFDKLFMKLFRHGSESRDEHKYIDQSFETFLAWTAGTVVGLFCIVTVAVPVGVLLLVPPSDLDAFFLVLFCSIFVLFVVIARIRSFATAFVAFSTYTAILVTSLSNLYQARIH